MATQKITRKQIETLASTLGLDVFTYSPGDGKTRYKFAPAGRQTCYWSGNGFTAVGIQEAEVFLRGYQYAGIWAVEPIRL